MKWCVLHLLLFLFWSLHCLLPTPKLQTYQEGKYLSINHVCNLRILVNKQPDYQKVTKLFKQRGTDPHYYLNKVLKRKNGNMECDIDKTPMYQKTKQNIINIKITVDASIVRNNEGYILQIAQKTPQIRITIKTYSGYIYALETLSQMIKHQKIQIGKIEDEPIVPHRGIMIDSARHFLKVDSISRLIQSMPLSKLNILHWHLSDDESFTIQLASHPELSAAGSLRYDWFYTLDQVRGLIDLGKKNGVWIIPQIDTPAHVRSWGLYKLWMDLNITITCPKGEGYNAQFDVSKSAVYQLAQDVYKELDNLFRDSPYIHLGGDEVFGACWDLRPAIKTFMAAKGIKDYGQLQMYWRYQMKQSLPQNRSVIFWRNDAQNIKTSDNDIIHYWGAQADIPKILGNVTSRIILSPSDYLYINKGIGNIWFNSSAGNYSVWKQIYNGFQVFPEGINRSRILGAEVTLWGEVSNDDTLENNIWMRATAFAEKMWTQKVKSIKDLVKDIISISDELVKMGVSPSPVVSQFCQKFTDKCLLN